MSAMIRSILATAVLLAAIAGGLASAEPLGVIGLIGVGKQGQRHLHELSLFPGVRVKAVDRVIDPALRTTYSRNPSIEFLTGDADLVLNDPEVTAVVIVTRGDTHHDIAKRALLKGKHVLVEKPFTDTTEQARDLVETARSQNRLLLVGHNRAHLPQLLRLRDMITAGDLGKILDIEGSYLNPSQRYDSTHTALEGLGYHLIYMIQTLIGKTEPTEIVAATRSEDWETLVGTEMKYGDMPVRINLSREYKGPKTRNIVVRGEKFTAIFDYSKEPGPVTLTVRPTHLPTPEEKRSIDLSLAVLRTQTIFSSEDERPSLHQQLKAFFAMLRQPELRKSNGAEAIQIVETLEDIRAKLNQTHLFVSRPITPVKLVSDLADAIYERIGDKGGLVAIDGLAGTGKSTLIKQLISLYELRHPRGNVGVLPFDELRLPWEICAVYKNLVLGIPLTPEQEVIRRNHGWNFFGAGTPDIGEENLWDNPTIANELTRLRGLFDQPPPEGRLSIVRRSAYERQGAAAVYGPSRRTYAQGDLVLVDGKFSNMSPFGDMVDLRVRISDDPATQRDRYMTNRAQALAPAELNGLMQYYDYIYPHWTKYVEATTDAIDVTVDFRFESITVKGSGSRNSSIPNRGSSPGCAALGIPAA